MKKKQPSFSSNRCTRSAFAIADGGYTVKNSRILFDGTQEDLKENRDMKEFHMRLSESEKKVSRRKTFQKKENVDITYCNYIGFKPSKNFLAFKIKL